MCLLLSKRWSPFAMLVVFAAVCSIGSAVHAQKGENADGETDEPQKTEATEADVKEDEDEESDEPRLLSTEQRAALKESAEATRPTRQVPIPIPIPQGYDEVGTAASAEMKAAGNLARDRGAAALLRSRAAINMQEATAIYLKNHVEYVKAYHAKRAAWREARELERRDRVTPEKAAKIAKIRSPERLSEDYFNPETGEILWPPVLDAEPLAPLREAIEEQFEQRASPGHQWNVHNAQWVKANVEAMQKAVDTAKGELPVQTYVGISQFLDSLAWEAEHDGSGNRVNP